MPWKPAPAEVRGACHRHISYSDFARLLPELEYYRIEWLTSLCPPPPGCVRSSAAVVARGYTSPTSPCAWVGWSSFPTTSHVSSTLCPSDHIPPSRPFKDPSLTHPFASRPLLPPSCYGGVSTRNQHCALWCITGAKSGVKLNDHNAVVKDGDVYHKSHVPKDVATSVGLDMPEMQRLKQNSVRQSHAQYSKDHKVLSPSASGFTQSSLCLLYAHLVTMSG